MSSEPLPSPTNVDLSSFRIAASLIGTNKNAANDVKDMFFFGDYVSSGSKYAVFYRNVTNARLSVGITSTKPATTVAAPTVKPLQIAKAYCATANCSSATASRTAYVDGTGAILATKLPFTSSYGQAYAPKNVTTYAAPNTYQTFGNVLVAGTSTSEWTITASSPGIGLKYTGAPAYVEVYYFVSYQGSNTRYTTVAVGSGTPTPGVPISTKTITAITCPGYATYAIGRSRAVFQFNTNDSVVPYTACSVAAARQLYTVHLLARVLAYV